MIDTRDSNGRFAYCAYRAVDGAYYAVGNIGTPQTLSVWMVVPSEYPDMPASEAYAARRD